MERYIIEVVDARTGVNTNTIREVVHSREEARERTLSLLFDLMELPFRPTVRQEK